MRTVSNPAAARGTDRLRRTRMRALRPALWLALLLPVCGGFSQQSPGVGQFPASNHHTYPPAGPDPLSSADGDNSVQAERRLRSINIERQKSLVADTNRLLQLANELNAEIAKSNPGELSPVQLRKVAEIEKLAHNVRDKMVMSMRAPMTNMDDAPFLPALH